MRRKWGVILYPHLHPSRLEYFVSRRIYGRKFLIINMKRRYSDTRTQANYERALKRRAFMRGQRAKIMPSRNRRIGGYLGIENKFYDTFTNYTSVSGAEAWTLLNPSAGCISAPAQGDGPSNRDGKKMWITSVHIKGCWRLPSSVNQTTCAPYPTCRVIVYLDNQTNGATPTIADILESTNVITSFRNLEYTSRFTILKDQVQVLQNPCVFDGTNIEYGGCVRPFKMNKKFSRPLEVNMTGSTAGVASVVDKSIGVLICSTDDGADFKYEARIRFKG